MLLLPWRRALHLLQSMPERTIQADHVTYNAALNALDSPGNWQLLIWIWHRFSDLVFH